MGASCRPICRTDLQRCHLSRKRWRRPYGYAPHRLWDHSRKKL